MNCKSLFVLFAAVLSTSAYPYADSLWVVGAEAYPGGPASVEVWLQFEGEGPSDSISAFDILLTYDASVCTAEAITIGADFSLWDKFPRIDNEGVQGPPAVAKLSISSFTFGPPIGPAFLERGSHLAATVRFRILDTALLGDSTYIDTLTTGFSPTLYLGFVGKSGVTTFKPAYSGAWIVPAVVHDITPTSILSPPAVVYVDSLYVPSAVVANVGPDSLGPISVTCSIDSSADTVDLAGIRGLDSVRVDFASWTPREPAAYTVKVTAQYQGDTNPTNDTLSLAIRAYLVGDMGVGSILSPPDTVYTLHSYFPSAVIKNFGTDSAGPFATVCAIDSWADTVEIPSVAGMDSVIAGFREWSVSDTGFHTVTIFTRYLVDTATANDTVTKSVQAFIPPGDVSPDSIISPPDTAYEAYNYRPSVRIANLSSRVVGPVVAVCEINGWSDTATVGSISGLGTVTRRFDRWTVMDTGFYHVTIFTVYPADTNSSNDTIRKTVYTSSSPEYTDSLWIVGTGGLPGELVTVEVWLQYQGGGQRDSLSAFDIPLTWDASICTVEAVATGPDFGIWTDQSKFDNTGEDGLPPIPKLGLSAFYFQWGPNVERGSHLAGTVDFRILNTAAPGESAYIDTLMRAFSPPIFLGFVDKSGIYTYVPGYSGGWVSVAHPGVGLEELVVEPPLPSIHALSGSHPNPADGVATISFQVATRCHLSLRIYDGSGRLVKVLVDVETEPGYYMEKWDGSDDCGQKLPGGTYFCRLETPEFSSTKKIVLLR